jgi:pimeloyl-ACP methyl ester carboxylesterase
MRLRNKFVSDTIMAGGVASAEALSPARRAELYDVGERLGHYQGFLSLLSHERRWSEARTLYPQIRIPALLIYGEQDWAPLARPPRVARHPEETAQGSVRLLLGEQEVQRPTDLAFRLREANDVKFCRRDALAHETRRACIRRPDETQ